MEYPCIAFSQRPDDAAAPRFCIFQAPAGEIESWTTIPTLSPEDTGGVQRAKNDFKVKSIFNFFKEDARNTIPTAIVITLAAGAYQLETTNGNSGPGKITLDPANKASAFVVDGQHRLYGLNLFNAAASIPIVAILDATNEEKAFQFIVINNKVSKVATDHIRALSINFTDPNGSQDLENRLRSARLSLSRNVGYVGLADETADSPFRGMVALPGKPAAEVRVVVPAAIESGIAYIQSKKFRQLADDEAAYEFFIAIWSTTKASWPQAFTKDSKLLTKVGLATMTRYVTDAIDFLATYSDQQVNISNAEDVSKAVTRILSLQSADFWLCDWTVAISDTKAVRDDIEGALKSIQQNIRDKEPWSNEVRLVKTKGGGT